MELVIPNESIIYYDQVYELIRYTLNNYKQDGIDSPELIRRTDAIINKCKKYSSGAVSYIESVKKENAAPVLVPEFIVSSGSDSLANVNGRDNDDNYILISLSKSIFIKFDMFLKEKENDKDFYEPLLYSFEYGYWFEKTGLRCKHADTIFTKHRTFDYINQNVPEIEIAKSVSGSAIGIN